MANGYAVGDPRCVPGFARAEIIPPLTIAFIVTLLSETMITFLARVDGRGVRNLRGWTARTWVWAQSGRLARRFPLPPPDHGFILIRGLWIRMVQMRQLLWGRQVTAPPTLRPAGVTPPPGPRAAPPDT
jgi:hypothetical protein